ncbi:MAG: hypothetical protein ABIY50_03740 [Ignavibacteria bacterium]
MTLSKKNLKLGKYSSSVQKTLQKLDKENTVKRIWEKDPTLWKNRKEYDALIRNRLGWLSLPVTMREKCNEINAFTDEVRKDGFRFAVVLGMGGSSMCPEVCRETFGVKEGYLKLFVIDSTDPKTIFDIENSLDLDKTLFIVSSKSGGTIEVDSFFRYFFEKVKQRKGEEAGKQFVAITDPLTDLEARARENGFRKIFTNPSDIGGRYSALSYFGLVPAAIIGIDIVKLLDRAQEMMDNCSVMNIKNNYGLFIGAAVATLAKKKKDKLTFILSKQIYSFGYWVEQLIAESTGKEGVGIVPIEGEILNKPSSYGKDRVFVYISLGKENDEEKKIMKALSKKDFPVIKIELKDLYDIGGQFYLWEFATAVMGVVLRINPFDEPNVKESKDNTGNVLKHFEEKKILPEQIPNSEEGELKLFLDDQIFSKKLRKQKSLNKWNLQDYLKFFIDQIKPGDYVGLMAYLQNNKSDSKILMKIRELIKTKLKVATTLGYGPRFLHSTGQLHKGGDDNGVFIQIVCEDSKDLEIPGKSYSFGILKQAQGIGDYESLLVHKRRVLKINIGSNTEKGLQELYRIIKKSI